MTHISEHNTKEEGEGYASENGWVNLLVHGHTISVDDFLKSPCKFVSLEVGGGLDVVAIESFELSRGVALEHFSDVDLIFDRAPEEADVGSLTLFHVVYGVIEGFFLSYKPFVYLQGADSLASETVIIDLINLYEIIP